MVFDEFTRSKQASWASIRSTLTHTEGRCRLIGNYIGSGNWGHILSKKALTDPEYTYFKWTADDAVREGRIKQSEVDQAKKDLPKQIFDALYMVEGGADNSTLFHIKDLLQLYKNDSIKGGKKYLTCDIALHGSDRFVMGYWNGLILEEIKVIDKCEADEATEQIKLFAERKGVPSNNVLYDADGLGSFLRGYLSSAKGFNNGGAVIQNRKEKINYANLKAQCYFTLSAKLGEISIRDESYKTEIIQELEAHKKIESTKWDVTKKKDVKELIGRSPDFSDMIMMRMYYELKPYQGEYYFN